MAPDGIIGRIMERHGAQCSVEEFHSFVNVTFHDFEAESYDELHQHMWQDLPQQFELLVDDYLGSEPNAPEDIHVLDVGCGTGRASDCLFKTAIGNRIRSVTLLDVSAEMLRIATSRVAARGVPVVAHHGLIDALPPDVRPNWVIVCSVLHHVPELPVFLRRVRALEPEGGVLMHLQDPNDDYRDDPELQRRITQARGRPLPEWLARLSPTRVWGRIIRELNGTQGQDYLSRTNRALLDKGIIDSPLSIAEIFAITDIHIHDEEGISFKRLRSWMPDYECVSVRAYGFFGASASTLPPRYRRVEEELIRKRALNGQEFGAIWKVRAPAQGR